MISGIIVPSLIEGFYMRTTGRTYLSQRRTIRSFYLAPLVGIILTLLGPNLYFWWAAFAIEGMFTSEYGHFTILVVTMQLIIVIISLATQVWQANYIRKRIESEEALINA